VKPELNSLARFLADVYCQVKNRHENIIVTDQNGTIIADSLGGKTNGLSPAERAYFIDAKKGDLSLSDPILSKTSGDPILTVAVPLKQEDGVFVGILISVIKLNQFSTIIIQDEKEFPAAAKHIRDLSLIIAIVSFVIKIYHWQTPYPMGLHP